MNLVELKEKLILGNIPKRWYSLDEGLKPDACILHKNYSLWEYFYLDEKGERHELTIFSNEEKAFDFLWKKMEDQAKIFKIHNLHSGK